MEAKEFKEKFKLGDKIICRFWIEVNYGHNTITYIGDEGFVSIDCENRECYSYFIDEDWQHYQEKNPKDLSDVFEYYTVSHNNGIKVRKCFGDKKHFESHKLMNENKPIEVITKEEAIERGFSGK